MEDLISEYKTLGNLHEIFKKYMDHDDGRVLKPKVFQMFFDYHLLDTCGINIFDLNNLLNELAAFDKGITMEHFLKLIFHIYSTQKDKTESDISAVSIDSINSLFTSAKPEYTFEIGSIINMFEKKFVEHQVFYYFMKPDINFPALEEIVSYSNLKKVEKYCKAIYDNLFLKYATKNKLNISPDTLSISIFDLNKFVFQNNIFANFNSDHLGQLFSHFFVVDDDINYVNENKDMKNTFRSFEDCTKEQFKTFCEFFGSEQKDKDGEIKCKKDKEIKEIFNEFILPHDYINFNFSAFVLIISLLATSIESTANLDFEDKIKFFFENIFYLKPDDNDNAAHLEDDHTKEEIVDDYVPESQTLLTAKSNPPKTNKDAEFLEEFLNTLNFYKGAPLLPEPDEIILEFMNEEQTHADTYSFYRKKKLNQPAKFPVEELMVEREEKKEKLQKEKEDLQIKKAAKPKKNNKEKVVNPCDAPFEDQPDIKLYDEKYFGKERIESLTHRLIKYTMKDILPNSNVFPSLIKEVLMIPKKINDKALENVVLSFKDQVTGHLEKAINRLEISKTHLVKQELEDNQVSLFYSLSLGSLYESLNFNLEALRFYYDAFNATQTLMPIDPDKALIYCFLGEIFLKLKEFIWSLRCFLMAKKIREDTIGGDTPDTATVYNNLGVVCYMLQSYLPANGYFKLAYEIYKETCGLTHPRTMMIKSNLSKMTQLNFNRKVQFKTLSLIPLPEFFTKSDKKKK